MRVGKRIERESIGFIIAIEFKVKFLFIFTNNIYLLIIS